jgi:phage gp29-like protein
MQQLLTRDTARPGTPLAAIGGLPPIRGQIQAAAAKSIGNPDNARFQVENISPSLASILRPQATYGRWLLPYLASITPQYIEMILRGALAGNHIQAWELFDLMIDTDPEIAACVQEYTDGICGKKVHFEPYCEEGEEPTPEALERCKLVSFAYRNMRPDAAADENGFDGTVKDIIAGRFHGQSLLEIDWLNSWRDGGMFVRDCKSLGNNPQVLVPRSTYWVHPLCYGYDMSGRLGLRLSIADQSKGQNIQTATKWAKNTKMGKLNDDPGTLDFMGNLSLDFTTGKPRNTSLLEFPRNKFLISILKAKTGTALGGSCLRPLAWWWVASNFCGDWLLNYAQLFGIPFRKATYKANTSETVKAEIRQMLQSAGSSGYILLPDSADLEFMKDGGGAGQSPQAFLFTFADSQKRKVILHQTQTGGHSGGGHGGFAGKFGEVEQQTKDACQESGCRHVENVINLQFTPAVLEMNYGDGNDSEAPTCKLVDNKVGGLVDAQRDQVLVQIMDVGEDWMRRKYGVPKPGPGEKLCGQDVGSTVGQKQMDQDAALQQQKVSADAQVQTAKHNADAAKAAGPKPAAGADSSSTTDNADLQDEAEAKAAKGAADAARAGMQDALEAGDVEGHWITSDGTHIFIKEGESPREAIKEKFGTEKTTVKKTEPVAHAKKQAAEPAAKTELKLAPESPVSKSESKIASDPKKFITMASAIDNGSKEEQASALKQSADLHEKQYGEWGKNLNDSDRDAIATYAGGQFSNMNDTLRGVDNDEESKAETKRLDAVFAKAPATKTAMTLYRGGDADLLGKNPESLIGKTIQDKGFVSTTTYAPVANGFAGRGYEQKSVNGYIRDVPKDICRFDINTPAGSKAISVDAALGKDGLDQHEMTLPHGSKFKITGMEGTKLPNGAIYWHVKAELVK